MRSTEVSWGLRNRCHSQVIKGTCKECCKCAGEGDGTAPSSTTHGHSHHVLLCYKTLNVSSREGLSVIQRVCGVLGVSIQSNNPVTILAQFDKTIGICLAHSNLECWKSAWIKGLFVVLADSTFLNHWNHSNNLTVRPHKPRPPRQSFETNFEISQSQVKI